MYGADVKNDEMEQEISVGYETNWHIKLPVFSKYWWSNNELHSSALLSYEILYIVGVQSLQTTSTLFYLMN